MCIVRNQYSPHLYVRAIVPLQMTDMQLVDSIGSMIPQPNDIDLTDDWKLLDQYSDLDNLLMPIYQIVLAILCSVCVVLGRRADKKASKGISALEERMYLLRGDVTIDAEGIVKEQTIHTLKERCWHYWKCWKCTKVSQLGSLHESRISFTRGQQSCHVEMFVSKF